MKAKLEELEKKYIELGEEIEKLKNSSVKEDWFPEDGEDYWTLNCNKPKLHKNRFKDTTIFHQVTTGITKTKEDCQKLCDDITTKIEILDELKRLNGDWKPAWDDHRQLKWRLAYDREDKAVRCYQSGYLQNSKYIAKSEEVLKELCYQFGDQNVCEALGVM